MNINGFVYEKKRIANLAQQVIAEYKECASERAEKDEWEWENDFDFTILGLMEIYSSYVGGYASQITTRGTVLEPQNAIKLLEQKRLFDESYFVDWYFSDGNKYAKVKRYANNLDYLRMLVIDYLQRYQNDIDSLPTPRLVSQNSAHQRDITPKGKSNTPEENGPHPPQPPLSQ